VPCTAVLLGRWNWWPSRLVTTAGGSVAADADSLVLAETAADGFPAIPPDPPRRRRR